MAGTMGAHSTTPVNENPLPEPPLDGNRRTLRDEMRTLLSNRLSEAVIQAETEPSFQYAMAMMMRPGDLPKATEFLATAAEGGHLEALFELGSALMQGFVPHETREELGMLDFAMGDDPNQEQNSSKWKLTRDYAEAQLHLEPASEKGHAAATQMLSVLYLRGGHGVEKDTQEGFRLLELAVARGDDLAQCDLAEYYTTGQDGWPKDPDKARELCQLAATQGGEHSIRAQSQLNRLNGENPFKFDSSIPFGEHRSRKPVVTALMQKKLDLEEPEYQFIKAGGLLLESPSPSAAAPDFFEAVPVVAWLPSCLFSLALTPS